MLSSPIKYCCFGAEDRILISVSWLSRFPPAPPSGTSPAPPAPQRGVLSSNRPHIRAPGPVHPKNPHLWNVPPGHAHGSTLHGQHSHQVRAVRGRAIHRAVELPAQVYLLQQHLLREPGGGAGVLGHEQPRMSMQAGLLLSRWLMQQTLGMRTRTGC